MTDFKHTERTSRQQAAERLTDVAYALVVRSPVALQIDGQRVVVPDAEELMVEWDVRYADGRLQLKIEVGWPGEFPAPARSRSGDTLQEGAADRAPLFADAPSAVGSSA